MFSLASDPAEEGMTSTEQRPPHTAYATIMGVFVGGLAVAGALARSLGRDPRENTTLDLAVLGMATFKAARTITRDEATGQGGAHDPPRRGNELHPRAVRRRRGARGRRAGDRDGRHAPGDR